MLTIQNTFVVIASLLSAIASLPYIYSILRGETKPSGASWWSWTLITMVTVVSSWFAGASWQVLVLPIWLCFVQFGIAILSIKRGDNNWDGLNKVCVAGVLVGVILWILVGEPLIALVIGIIADMLASIPNFRHVFKNPEQENRTGWTLGWLSSVFELFAMGKWSVAESGWALYFFGNMTVTLFLVWRKQMLKIVK